MKKMYLLLLTVLFAATSINAQVSVTATAGTTGPTAYTNLSSAFTAINAGTHQGAVTIGISASFTDAAVSVLNSSGAGTASYTSVLIRPTADGVVMSFASATGRGVIELNGADNVTIDGDNPNTGGTNRNLTITNTATNAITFTSCIRLATSTLITSCDNDIIKNCNLNGSGTGRNIAAATSEIAALGIVASAGASTAAATTAPSALTSATTTIASGQTVTNLIIDNNNIQTNSRGISVNGAAATVAVGLLVTNNIVGNATVGAADQVTGIGITVQGTNNGIVRGNTVRVEGYIEASAVNKGIDVGTVSTTGLTNVTVEKNIVERVINNDGTSWPAYGINIVGGTNHIVQNNFVGNCLNSQVAGSGAFSTTFGCFGIRIAAGAGHKIYHNSVHFTGVVPGSTSTDLIACLGIVSTTSTGMDIRNNIFSNRATGGNTTPYNTVFTCVYVPSITAMTLIMNNNAYYQGALAYSGIGQVSTTGSAANLYLAGNFNASSTTPATNWRAVTSAMGTATNDNNSYTFTTAPPFVSATDLHIPNGTSTPLESSGAAVGVTNDIDNDVRNATTPDLGGDEFNGVFVDLQAPSINYTALTAACSGANRTLTGVTISDAGGVPTTGTLRPRIYYKKNAGSYFSQPGTLTSGTGTSGTWDFTIVAADMGGLTLGDIVSYYVIAQDVAAVPNISSNPSGVIATDVNTVTTHPAVPNTYVTSLSLGGTYTVGVGGNFTTLTAAVAAYNSGCGLTGPVTFSLINATYPSETYPISINQNASASAVNTLTIKPAAGVAATLSGNNATVLIKLNGADYVIFDGVNSGGSSLTIQNTNSANSSTVIWIASNAADGATNNTIKNCTVTGNTGSTTISCILAGDGVTLGNAATAANSNNTIQGNILKAAQNGIYVSGVATVFDQNWVISNNTIGSTTVANDKMTFRGMSLQTCNNFTINGNTIAGVVSTSTSAAIMTGISIYNAVTNATITNNKISDIKQTSTTSVGSNGIGLFGTTIPANITVANNLISDIASFGSATSTANGNGIIVSTGSGYNIYYNTVRLNTEQTAATGIPAAINIASGITTAGAVNLRDNIFTSSQTIGTNRYAIYSAAANTVFAAIDYNDYFTAGPNLGFIGSNRVDLAAVQTGFGGNTNSKNILPVYLSPTDAHLNAGYNPTLNNLATPIAGITTDIDGDTRNAATPDMGADEFNACTPPTTATASSNSPVCAGTTLNLTGTTDGTTFAWTGPNSFSSTLQNPSIPNVTVAAAGVYTFQSFLAGCPSLASTTTVVINPQPTIVSVGASAATICPGGSVNLTSSVNSNSTPPITVLSEGFEAVAGIPAGWVSVNAGTGNLWVVPQVNGAARTGTRAAEYNWNTTQAGTAYLISSGVALTGGITYTVSSWYRNSGTTFPEKLKVTVGTAQTIAAQTTLIQDVGVITSTTYLQQLATFTPAVSGTYYFGWNAYSDPDEFYLDVDDILITTAPPPTYSWTSNPAGFTSNLQNPTGVTPAVTTIYTLTATNSFGCSASGNVTVTVNNPVAIATPSSQTICSGAAVTTIALSSASPGTTTYTWTRNNPGVTGTIGNSGSGDISGTLINSTASPITVTFTITAINGGCIGTTTTTATVTVNPTNTITLTSAPATTSQTVCINTPITNITYSTTSATGATFSGLPAGVTGAWAANVVTISGSPTTTAGSPFSYTVTLTGGCGTVTASGTITVTPNNTITLTSAPGTNAQSVCLNSPIGNITYSTTGATGATFTGLPAGVTGAWAANVVTISGTPTTTVGSPFNYTITLTGGCGAITANGSITVKPLPLITSTQIEPTTCASADGSINITVAGAPGPYTYVWTGSGVIPGNEDQINLTVGSYDVTVTAANGCTATANFALSGPGGCSICPTIPNFATTPSGAACFGSNVTFTASGLTDMGTTYGIIFKYSTVALANPYVGGTVIATVLNGALTGGKTIATANSATVPVGSYFVYAILTPTPVDPLCRPAAQVSLIIGATPDVNQPANQVVCNNTATAAVNFTGSVAGTVYNWTNSAPSIGLAASGTGNIASFTATNASNAAVVATITVTPQFTTGPITCSGTPKTFTITVNPTPIVNPVTSQAVCNGALTAAVNFTSPTTGPTGSVTFTWTNSNTAIGLGASGTGNIAAFTGTNASAAPISGTITVTPVYTGGSVTCTGTPITFTITVNPTPTVNAQTNQIVCSGSTATATFTGAVAGTVYNWTNTNTAIGLGASGTGNISFTATNAGVVPIVGTITVTPTYTNGGTTCSGTPTSFTITVNPTPTVNAIPNQVLCQNAPTAPVNFTGTPAGVVFQWTNNNTLIGLAAAGTGNIPSFIALNPTAVQQVATITVTPVTGLSTPVTTTFAFTGAVQTYTVPAGITSINIKTWGAQGNTNALGAAVGGLGGYAEGNLAVVAGQVLNVNVGGGAATSINGGFNGGGAAGVNSGCATAQGGGGGGASDVRIAPYALANRVIVGAGGGGAGANRVAGCGRGTGGGGGGGYFGGGGGAAWPGVPGSEGPVPTGGTQVAGGAGGITTFNPGPTNGFPGVVGVGGAGGTEIGSAQGGSATAEPGGIGGGLTGGSGLYNNVNNWCGQSGAGGSSYIGGVSGGLTTPGIRSGNGQVQITYTPASATTCFGAVRTFTITVNPNANLIIVADPGTTICEGDPTLLTVYDVGASTAPGTLYTQGTTAINGSPSQVFEPANTAFNSQTADDFNVPAGATWTITRITANGIGAGVPTSVNVFFYANSGSNLPGTAIASLTNITTFTQVGGNYTVTLPSSVSLTAGRYWMSFQVNMAFAAGGQWFWGNYGPPTINSEYAFQNPGGGFATPCTNWGYGGTGCNVGGGPANTNSIFSVFGTSVTPGAQSTGTFLWSPALGLSSTTSNPVAASPQNTTTYTVTRTTVPGGCQASAQITITVNKRPVVTTQPVASVNCSGTTATFTVGATGTGLTYQWQVSTAGCAGPWVNLFNGAPYSNVTTPTLTISPVTGLMNGYGYRCVVSGVCAPWIPPTNVSNCALLTVNPLPVVNITPPISCGGVAGSFGTQLSVASIPPPVPGSVTVSSGTINLAIPDNTAAGVSNIINVAGVPATATITNISVALNMPHTYPADMIFNLKAPNGQILNLYKHNTNTDNGAASIPTAGFYNAVANATSAVSFVSVPTPYRYGQTAPAGPYRADALNGVTNPGYTIMDPNGFVSNAANFAALYSTPNGAYTLAMADGGPGDVGTLASWSITIDYTTPGTTGSTLSYIWSPLAGLYNDAGASSAYTGTNTPVVYAAPTVFTTYTVTATNTVTGCVNTAKAFVNYTPPAPTVTPSSVTMCLGDPAVRLVSSSSTSTNLQFCSGPISVVVPDANPAGATSNLTVSGVPATCNVSAMAVTFNMNHTWDGDIVVALKAPNGQILNLDYYLSTTGGTGATTGFVNTKISSTGTAALSSGANPYTGTFKADGVITNAFGGAGGPTGFTPTVTTWAPLFANPNGVWTLAMKDGFGGDQGTLTSWCIDLTYVCGVIATPATWSPIAGLFNDAAAGSPYVAGTPRDTVWVRPTPSGVYTYQATVQSVPVPPLTFANTAPITINAVGTATPSPANLSVSGLPTTGVTVKNVNINGLSHTWGGDVNIVLQSPGGQNVILLANSNADPLIALNNVNLTFSDAATASIPTTAIPSGTYLPTNRNGSPFAFLAPGPTVTGPTFPASPTLTTFTGNMNGTWKLFVEDRVAGDQGSISGGFSVGFDLGIAACTSPPRTVVVTVNQPATLSTSLPVNTTVCTDKVATFSVAVATGTGPFTYQWQVSTDNGNSFTNITNGGVYSGATTATLTITAPPVNMSGYQYRAIVTGAAPCASVISFKAVLTVNPLPTVGISANRTSLFPGLTATISSTVGPFAAVTYTWLRNNAVLSSGAQGIVSGIGTTPLVVNVDGFGTYKLRVTDVNGCTGESTEITIKDSVSGKCFIYPNPTSGLFEVRYYSTVNNIVPRSLTVFDAKGERVFTKLYPIGRPYDRMPVDMRAYGKGLYWVEVTGTNGERLTMCRVAIQ